MKPRIAAIMFSVAFVILISMPHLAMAIYTDDVFEKPVYLSNSFVEVSFDNSSYIFAYPFEHSIDRIVKIKNLRNEPVEIDMRASVPVNGGYVELPNWPQPFPNSFGPLEEKEIVLKLEWGNNMVTTWTSGQTYYYPFLLNISKRMSQEIPLEVSLENKVLVLENENNADNLKANANISGTILDDNENPVSGARVKVWSDWPRVNFETSTDSSGTFNVPVTAYQRRFLHNWIQYSIDVEKDGFDTFHAAVSPEENGTVNIVGKMIEQSQRADYSLVAKYDTGLPTARVSFSKNGEYFATVPFHSSESIDFIKERAYLHLFNSNGSLVCKYKLDNEVPTVSISDDSSIIATIHRPSTESWGGGDYIVLLNRNCSELWRDDSIYEKDDGISEVALSHDGKYLAAGTFMGRILLIDVNQKKIVWNYSTGEGQVRNILFDNDGSGVFFGSDPNLFHYHINGDLEWKAAIGAWPYSMAVSSNYIFVGVKAGRFLSLINKANGNILWRYPIDARPDNMLISPDETYFIYQSSNGGLAIKNAFFDVSGNLLFNLQGANSGYITPDSEYIAYYGGNSVRLVNKMGSQLWSYQLDPEKWPAPRGSVYVSEDKSKIIVADAVNGNVYFFQGSIENITTQLSGNNQEPVRQPEENQPISEIENAPDNANISFPDTTLLLYAVGIGVVIAIMAAAYFIMGKKK